jgi:hypothetical protein
MVLVYEEADRFSPVLKRTNPRGTTTIQCAGAIAAIAHAIVIHHNAIVMDFVTV